MEDHQQQTIRTHEEMFEALERMSEALSTDEGNAMLAESIGTTNEEISELVMMLMPAILMGLTAGQSTEGAFMFAVQVGIAIANDAR